MQILTGLSQQSRGHIRTSEAEAAGVSRAMLSKLVRAGRLERIAYGQYILPDELPDELLLLQRRVVGIIYSHETALFLHGIAERTPVLHSVTIASGKKLSPATSEGVKVYRVKPELHGLGAVVLPSKMGNEVRAYDLERTICDVLRSRNRMDDQVVVAAMKAYAAHKGQNMNKLRLYAQAFHVTKILRQYLEVLL
jgi:predicted transcriptional regulator of viral defense system